MRLEKNKYLTNRKEIKEYLTNIDSVFDIEIKNFESLKMLEERSTITKVQLNNKEMISLTDEGYNLAEGLFNQKMDKIENQPDQELNSSLKKYEFD